MGHWLTRWATEIEQSLIGRGRRAQKKSVSIMEHACSTIGREESLTFVTFASREPQWDDWVPLYEKQVWIGALAQLLDRVDKRPRMASGKESSAPAASKIVRPLRRP